MIKRKRTRNKKNEEIYKIKKPTKKTIIEAAAPGSARSCRPWRSWPGAVRSYKLWLYLYITDIHVYVCIYIYIYIHVYAYMYIYIYIYTCVCIRMFRYNIVILTLHICSIYLSIYMFIYLLIYLSIYLLIYVILFIFIWGRGARPQTACTYTTYMRWLYYEAWLSLCLIWKGRDLVPWAQLYMCMCMYIYISIYIYIYVYAYVCIYIYIYIYIHIHTHT